MDGEQAQHIMMQYSTEMAFTKRPSQELQQAQAIISYQQQEITSCDTQQARKKAAAERLSLMQEQKHGSRSSWKRETPLNQEQQRQTCHTYSQHKKIKQCTASPKVQSQKQRKEHSHMKEHSKKSLMSQTQ